MQIEIKKLYRQSTCSIVSLKIQRIFKNNISVSPNFSIQIELSLLFSPSITHHSIIGIADFTAGKLTFTSIAIEIEVANVPNSFIRGNYVTIRSWVPNKQRCRIFRETTVLIFIYIAWLHYFICDLLSKTGCFCKNLICQKMY